MLIGLGLAAAVALAAAQHPTSARFVYTDSGARLAGGDGNDVTVALGATVRFAYPEGVSKHNVNLERPGPECVQLAGAGAGSSGRILPSSTEGPGWVVECRFPVPGIYHFGSDENGTLHGVVRVANADGSVPTGNPSPQPTPQETFVPGSADPGGPSRGATTSPAGSTPRLSIARRQRGARIRVVVTGGSERSRIVVEARAKRTDLRTKGKARLVRVGRAGRTVGAGARVTVTVRLNARARAALRRLKRMTITVRVTGAGKAATTRVTVRR